MTSPDTVPSTNATSDDIARLRAELLAEFRASARPHAPIPFSRFRVEFLKLYEPPMRKKATYGATRYVLGIIADLIGPDATTDALTTDLVARFIGSRPSSQAPATTRGQLQYVRTICNHCVAQGYLRISPFALRKRWVRGGRGKADTKIRHHSIEDIGRVLELAQRDIGRKIGWAQWRARRLYALVATVAYTGMRASEAQHLWTNDLVFPDRMILIRERDGSELKTDASAQPVPMTEALARILAEWTSFVERPGWLFPNAARTGPWTSGSPRYKPVSRCKRLGERLGIENFTFLSLRHSWATHAESAWGFSEAFIQRVLRHTTTMTQHHYRHADACNLVNGMRAVAFGVEDDTCSAPPAFPSLSIEFPEPSKPTPGRRGSLDPKNPARPGVWHRPKLTPEDVAEARELRARGWTYARLRARYGVSKSTLSALFNGLTHRLVVSADGE